MKDNPSVTVYAMVEAGSKYETKETNGISHFLEHMVFKGTPRRPKAILISRELDALGADYNAFTGDEYTGYYAKVDRKHADKALDIISDMYLNPLFPEEEIQKEKGVIIEEIRMYKDRPERQVHNALDELLYGDQPAGWTVLGPEENIKSFSREHFLEYRNKHYVASATTVVVAGDINEKEMQKKVEKIFAPISTGKKQKKLKVKESQNEAGLRVVYKDTGQTHVAFGIRTFSFFHKERFVARVLATILGGGMSSRLFSKMRDELGICYYVRAGQNSYTDHGYMGISAGVDTNRVELALKTILEEVERFKTELVSDEELQRAKDSILGGMMLGLETSDARADFAAHDETLRHELRKPEEIMKDFQKVTAQEIKKLARKYFVDKNLNMAIIGPYKDEVQFKKILAFKK